MTRGASFLAGNVAAQGSGAVTGLLLARWMSLDDYALYTIIMTLMGAISVLTKGGIHLGFTAILGRHWPDMGRAASLVDTALDARRRVAWIILPPILLLSGLILLRNGARPIMTLALLGSLLLFWWADMRTKIVDQILFFAKQTGRVQLLDTGLGFARLLAICALKFAGALGVLAATIVGVLVAILRIWPINRWIQRLLPETGHTARKDDKAEINRIVLRQLPVELFYVGQGQIILLFLTLYGSTGGIAGYGALGRIAQLLLPLQAFSYAFCMPIFAREKRRPILVLAGLIGLCATPGLLLIGCALAAPWALLWLIGPHYAHLGGTLLVCAVTTALSSVIGIAWSLVAHRGWNRFTWLQIPIGVAWCAMAPLFLKVGTIEGALWLQCGFAIGTFAATAADLAYALRQRAIEAPGS